jgi:hypothetical protein
MDFAFHSQSSLPFMLDPTHYQRQLVKEWANKESGSDLPSEWFSKSLLRMSHYFALLTGIKLQDKVKKESNKNLNNKKNHKRALLN